MKHHTSGQYTHGSIQINMPGIEDCGTIVLTLSAPRMTAGATAIAAGTKILNDATACRNENTTSPAVVALSMYCSTISINSKALPPVPTSSM